MKKISAICCICLLLSLLSGCGKVIELTDEENYMVAEYAAELLLKYDRNIDLKYYSDNVISSSDFVTTEMATTEILTTEAYQTEEITYETTEKTDDTISVTEDNPGDTYTSSEHNIVPDETPEEDVSVVDIPSNVQDNNFDIASFAGVNTVSIKYAYYMLLDQYPSLDHDGVAITIDAPPGYKLLVLKFNMENKTGDDQYVDMFSKELEYSVIVDGNKKAKQMLTILIDDLYTYQGTVDGNMFEEVVLLFQVSDSVAESMQSLKLQVTDTNNNDVVIDLE
ncbi:MAG: hypothetical protein IJV15_12920 [Lachnospiraceae bacterium]|nr:hypothetical protein [Lachnospiraceae bacterium]